MLNHLPVTRFDFNENLDGTSFTKTKDWKPIAPEWNKYAWEQFGELSFTPLLQWHPVQYLHSAGHTRRQPPTA